MEMKTLNISINDEIILMLAQILRQKVWIKTKLKKILPTFIKDRIDLANRGRENQEFIEKLKEMRFVSQPIVLNIDMTNNCNAKCQKCTVRFLQEKGVPRGIMVPETFNKIISDIKELISQPLSIIYLEGAGEAIMNPHIVDYVSKARDENVANEIGLGSNMLALRPELLEKLLDAGLSRLKMSVDTREKINKILQSDAINYLESSERLILKNIFNNFTIII